MDKDLEKLVKSGRREERNAGMDMLARSASPSDITFLMRIANAGWRKFIGWYDLEDQIYALNRLLDTNKPEAVEYVRQYFACEDESIPRGYDIPVDTGGGINSQSDAVPAIWIKTIYPHARGSIKTFLELAVLGEEFRTGDTYEMIVKAQKDIYQRLNAIDNRQ